MAMARRLGSLRYGKWYRLDLWEGVEPLQQGAALGALVEAAVEFSADRLGQPDDFTVAGEGDHMDRINRMDEHGRTWTTWTT
jgi:hypothetical protein